MIGTAMPTIHKLRYCTVTDGLNSHEFSATGPTAVQISPISSFSDQRLDTKAGSKRARIALFPQHIRRSRTAAL
jgi:hypothetical protein